jgi:hypothetical protein
MAKRSLSEWDLVNNVLADACIVAGSQQAWAAENAISPQFVCDVLQGRRAPTEMLARALGYRRIISFERIEP